MLCGFLGRNPTLKDVPAEEAMSTFAGLNFPCEPK